MFAGLMAHFGSLAATGLIGSVLTILCLVTVVLLLGRF
jgi:hypothetical protein